MAFDPDHHPKARPRAAITRFMATESLRAFVSCSTRSSLMMRVLRLPDYRGAGSLASEYGCPRGSVQVIYPGPAAAAINARISIADLE
jgi:hypothetical protein